MLPATFDYFYHHQLPPEERAEAKFIYVGLSSDEWTNDLATRIISILSTAPYHRRKFPNRSLTIPELLLNLITHRFLKPTF